MSIVQIDDEQLIDSGKELKYLAQGIYKSVRQSSRTDRLLDFTRVSGLDQLGAEHARVLDSGPASATETAKGLGKIIEGLALGVKDTAQGFEAQERCFSQALDAVEVGGCAGVGEETGMVTLTETVSPVPLVVSPKTVVPPTSVIDLLRSYFTTETSAIGEAVDAWKKTAQSMDDATARLRQVANDIQAANKGDAIDAIVDRIRRTSEATESFSHNAQAMSRWTGRMNLTHKLGTAEAAFINGQIMTNPVPGVRQLEEKLALLAYAKYAMPPLLTLAEPRVHSLLDVSVPPSEGGTLEAELEDIATTAKKDLERHIEGIRTGNPDKALVRELHELTAANASDSGTSVSGLDACEVGTTPQSAASAIASPQVSGIGNSGTNATGLVPEGKAGSPSIGAPGRSGMVPAAPMGATRGGRGNTGGKKSRFGSSTGVRAARTKPSSGSSLRTSAANANATGKRLSAARGGVGSLTSSRATGNRDRHSAGLGIGAGAGLAAAGSLLAPGGGAATGSEFTQRGVTAKVASGAGMGPAGATNAASRGAGATRGVMPMGMAPQGRNKRSRNIKTVTPELEQDANIKAIVGEAPPMVPGTIGAWARR